MTALAKERDQRRVRWNSGLVLVVDGGVVAAEHPGAPRHVVRPAWRRVEVVSPAQRLAAPRPRPEPRTLHRAGLLGDAVAMAPDHDNLVAAVVEVDAEGRGLPVPRRGVRPGAVR